jgi:predicted LPLAT superfamily acyltransferase
MSGRSRRVVQKKGAAEVAAALAQLNAAKAGSKRLDTFELKEEKAVYDVVDDEQYAQLVTKRRIEAGKFWGLVDQCVWVVCGTVQPVLLPGAPSTTHAVAFTTAASFVTSAAWLGRPCLQPSWPLSLAALLGLAVPAALPCCSHL